MVSKLAKEFNVRLKALFKYKAFIFSMVVREFKGRYMGSLLGSIWSILNPMAMIFIYTIIFSKVMGARLQGTPTDAMAYGIFLCAGLLPWGYFSELLLRCQTIFIEQANLIKKVNFPRITLPVIVLLSSTINFLIILGIFLFFLLITGRFPGVQIFSIIPLLLLQQAIALGLGMTFGAMNVFFRDIGQLIGVVLQFWFWLTPIIYPISILPETLQHVIYLNPLTRFMIEYQNIILKDQSPNWFKLKYHLIFAVVILIIGFFTFYRLSNELVDEL